MEAPLAEVAHQRSGGLGEEQRIHRVPLGLCGGEIIPLALSRWYDFFRMPAGTGDKTLQAVLAPYPVELCRGVAALTDTDRQRFRRIEGVRGADLNAPAAALVGLAERRAGVHRIGGKRCVCQYRAETLPSAKFRGQAVPGEADLTQARRGGRLLMREILDQHTFGFPVIVTVETRAVCRR